MLLVFMHDSCAAVIGIAYSNFFTGVPDIRFHDYKVFYNYIDPFGPVRASEILKIMIFMPFWFVYLFETCNMS